MPLWIDKHRPKTLKDLTFHENLTERLEKLSQSSNLPHLLFYGPSGAGKNTRIHCFLRELFGNGVDKMRVEHKSFRATASKMVDITVLASNFHLELNPSDVGIYDRVVVTEIIKEIAGAQSLATTTTSENPISHRFKIVVINEADQLSKIAQQGLRRTMEKFAKTCRLILVCNSLSKVIEPVRSRCLAIRVPSPSDAELVQLCRQVGKWERLPEWDPDFLRSVVDNANRNARRLLLILETSKISPSKTEIVLPDWERYVELIAREITTQQSPQQLLDTRSKMYELLANCIPPEVIFKQLTMELCKRVDNDLKYQIVHFASLYQARLASQGQKPIYHLEAFVAKFMCLYKEYLVSMFA